MNHLISTAVAVIAAAIVATLALPAAAASSAASSASDSLTTSSGSVSGSLRGSSGSSTGTNNVAEGDYRIVEVAAAPQRPGDVQLTLRRGNDAAADDTLYLTVPQSTLERSRLTAGDMLAAKHRPYGIEFADGRTRAAFFLVLDDGWIRDLKTVVVPG